eukprot:1082817-Prymnesium_polylepis.2
MDSAKNKRLLLAACQANGIALPHDAPPGYMQARILDLRPAKMARTDDSGAAPPPTTVSTLNKTTFVEEETERIGASLGGVTARNKPQLTAEAESRYEEIKARLKKDDDLFLENVTPDMAEQLKTSGWVAVIVEPSGTYFCKPAAPPAKSTEPEPQEKASDILEAQDEAYAIAQVADMEKAEADQAAALAAKTVVAPETAAAAAPAATVDAARDEEIAEELVVAARRRLMDWLVINNNSVAMGEILGLGKHSMDNREVINPRLLASKFAYAVFPEGSELVGLSRDDTQKAAKPDTLWIKAEIDLLIPTKPVSAEAAAPVDEAATVEKKEAATVEEEAAAAETDGDAAQAPAPEPEKPLPSASVECPFLGRD